MSSRYALPTSPPSAGRASVFGGSGGSAFAADLAAARSPEGAVFASSPGPPHALTRIWSTASAASFIFMRACISLTSMLGRRGGGNVERKLQVVVGAEFAGLVLLVLAEERAFDALVVIVGQCRFLARTSGFAELRRMNPELLHAAISRNLHLDVGCVLLTELRRKFSNSIASRVYLLGVGRFGTEHDDSQHFLVVEMIRSPVRISIRQLCRLAFLCHLTGTGRIRAGTCEGE